MEKYIGVKIVKAEPMTAEMAEIALNKKIDTSRAQMSAEGYPGYIVEYEDGYKS